MLLILTPVPSIITKTVIRQRNCRAFVERVQKQANIVEVGEFSILVVRNSGQEHNFSVHILAAPKLIVDQTLGA